MVFNGMNHQEKFLTEVHFDYVSHIFSLLLGNFYKSMIKTSLNKSTGSNWLTFFV